MPYCFDRKSRIIILGKNIRAEDLEGNLVKNGFCNLCICGGELNTVIQDEKTDQDAIWFLAFQNARRHKEFAVKLHELGINKIIFLPTDEAVNWKEAIRIRQIYNYLLYGEAEEGLQVPFYDEIAKRSIDTANAVISEACGMTTFYARMEAIFVNNLYKKCSKSGHAISLPLVGHYRSMFEKMAGQDAEESDYQEYCEEQRFTKENYEEKTFDRYQLYCLFKKNINRGEFFSASASIVAGNKNGVFHIKEGLHRVVFLMMQGWSYIPVMISTKEFQTIYPEEKIAKAREFFEKNQIDKTVTPIAHPAFYNFPAEKEMLEPSVLTAIKKLWGIGGFCGKKILDMSDYNSYFARNIGRVLWDCDDAVIESRETDEVKFRLAVLYNDLLNIQNVKVEYQSSLKLCSNYDIVFLLGKIKFDSENINFLVSLDLYVQDAVVFECDMEDSEEQIGLFTANTGFDECVYLHRYFNGARMRQVLVFRRKKEKSK